MGRGHIPLPKPLPLLGAARLADRPSAAPSPVPPKPKTKSPPMFTPPLTRNPGSAPGCPKNLDTKEQFVVIGVGAHNICDTA